MKKQLYIFILGFTLCLLSCDDYLTQEDPRALSTQQVYQSVSGINSVAANLYDRLYFNQNFSNDGESYDLTRWDEASNNSAYWQFAGNVGGSYRNYYNYGFIRDVNQHIIQLSEQENVGVSENERKYFLAEARFLRALVYFRMVESLGGVPIIEEVYDYSNTPIEYAKARNTEAEVYDYIAREIDEIADDLDTYTGGSITRTRATKGAALALKSRAMLYAGTIAKNYSVSSAKGLNLSSGATGIPSSRANEYFQKSLDAYNELESLGYYSLYEQSSDLGENFYNLFITKNNSEQIFYIDYDGNNFKNRFTERAIARSQRSSANSGSQINPVLNLVEDFELVATKEASDFDAYVGNEVIENLAADNSTLNYVVYDNKEDIFEGRDPRLWGTVIYPGSSFRGKDLQFQAGLAEKTGSGYQFRSAATIEKANQDPEGYFNNVRMTGEDGPHRTSWYVSHTGFLMRKFVDPKAGSEASGASDVPYSIFRYGEVILNAAEAAYQLGNNNLALTLINKIRNRAGGPQFELTLSELTMERIMNERRVELAFEDHRFYDLKRWRIADEIWDFDRTSTDARLTGLWPYKIYAPGDPDDGKWIYRRVWIEHRGTDADLGRPINFELNMYYPFYPKNNGNPEIEQNPQH